MNKAKDEYYKEYRIFKYEELVDRIKELEQKIEDMKCCGNCEDERYRLETQLLQKCNENINGTNCCKRWQYDGLSQKERMG